MNSRNPTFSLLLLTSTLVLGGCFRAQTYQEIVAERIRDRIFSARTQSRIVINQDAIRASNVLSLAYKARDYRAFWSAEQAILPRANSLIDVMREVDREGLSSQDYHLAVIEAMIDELQRDQEIKEPAIASRFADLDLLLTDAFLLIASHLARGKVNHETLQPNWSFRDDTLNYPKLLEGALQSNEIEKSLQALQPQHAFYRSLRGMLSSLEAVKNSGGWGIVPDGPEMRAGSRGKRVAALKRRLAASGDLLLSQHKESDLFDSSLADAVRRFQRRHGLSTSGIIDSVTFIAVNVRVEKRIEQIRANLERWRWLPHEIGQKMIIVNIADFKLSVVEDDSEIMTMKVVVGNPDRQTPVFSANMTQVLFNDYWIAPHHILASELINYMKADSNYLQSNGMVLLRGSGDSLEEIDPSTINFAELNPKDIDFRLRQGPGPSNIMGQVKFFLPNEYDVFLHDTPYREDFAKNVRMYSHGCIRLEKPFELAEYLLRSSSGWTKDTILAVVKRIERRLVNLRNPVPVHVLYGTAWVEKDGSMEFREDCYGKDKRLNDALLEGPPAVHETLAEQAKARKR